MSNVPEDITKGEPVADETGDGGRAPPDPGAEKSHTDDFRCFEDWANHVRASPNRPAAVADMVNALYPHMQSEEIDFGHIATVAATVGGWGRLVDLLWQNSTRPPTGDVFKYIQGIGEHQGNEDHAQEAHVNIETEGNCRSDGVEKHREGLAECIARAPQHDCGNAHGAGPDLRRKDL